MDRSDVKIIKGLILSLKSELERVSPGAGSVIVTGGGYRESYSSVIELFLSDLGLLSRRTDEAHEVLPPLRKRKPREVPIKIESQKPPPQGETKKKRGRPKSK